MRYFDRAAIRAHAERFGVAVFRRRFIELLRSLGVDPSLYRADRQCLSLNGQPVAAGLADHICTCAEIAALLD